MQACFKAYERLKAIMRALCLQMGAAPPPNPPASLGRSSFFPPLPLVFCNASLFQAYERLKDILKAIMRALCLPPTPPLLEAVHAFFKAYEGLKHTMPLFSKHMNDRNPCRKHCVCKWGGLHPPQPLPSLSCASLFHSI